MNPHSQQIYFFRDLVCFMTCFSQPGHLQVKLTQFLIHEDVIKHITPLKGIKKSLVIDGSFHYTSRNITTGCLK